jgi:hypothetical protein
MDDAVSSPLRGDLLGRQCCSKKENQQERLGFDQPNHLENIHDMSASGPKPTFKKHRSMSAFGGLADIQFGKRHFRCFILRAEPPLRGA